MSQLFTGSINLTKLLEEAKAGKSAFTKSAKNGNIYCNIAMWLNDEKDQYGNDGSIQINGKKEDREKEGKGAYIGNFMKQGAGEPIAPAAADLAALPDLANLPF